MAHRRKLTRATRKRRSSPPRNSSALHLRARAHDNEDAKRLPPVISSGNGGQPYFAFLSDKKFSTKYSKIVAIEFYTKYVNEHLMKKDTEAGAFRITCSMVPDLAFEYVRPAWNMKAAIAHTFRKLKMGSGPKRLQAVFDRHKKTYSSGALEIQYLTGMKALPSTLPGGVLIYDMFDFCEHLQRHMKADAKRLLAGQHRLEESAALRIQCRYRIRMGKFAVHLKRQALEAENAELEHLNAAALKIQLAWRRKKGQLVLHLKRQAKREWEAERKREEAAALTIQLAWRRKKGQLVMHMKRRLKAEQDEMERAAVMIQNAWRRRDAKKMVSNMKKRMMEEEAEMEAAALTIQLAWRRKKGQLVLHMKRRIKAEEEEQTRAAIMIQNAWRRRDAKKMVANMKKRMMDEEEELNRAALKIQCAWRRRQGTLALHMKRQAKQSVYDAEAWVVLYDKDQNGAYFYDYSTHSSLWKLPEKLVKTGLHTDEWIVCEDQTRRLTYYFRTTDGSCHPIDEHSAHYQQNKWYNYSNPPPMAKIALKSEHFPKQGMVTTDIELARAEMSGIGGYYNEQYQGSFEQNYSNNYEHGPNYY